MESTSSVRYTCVCYAIDAGNTYEVLVILSFIKGAIILSCNFKAGLPGLDPSAPPDPPSLFSPLSPPTSPDFDPELPSAPVSSLSESGPRSLDASPASADRVFSEISVIVNERNKDKNIKKEEEKKNKEEKENKGEKENIGFRRS